MAVRLVHPQLHFISHIPQNIKGEQLIAQLFRNIPERTWLFKYGRVPMSLILGEWIWEVRFHLQFECYEGSFYMSSVPASIRRQEHHAALQSQRDFRSHRRPTERDSAKPSPTLQQSLPSHEETQLARKKARVA